MPGPAHETLVAVLRDHPERLRELLEATGRQPVPSGLLPEDTAIRFSEPAEVRPDLLLGSGAGGYWALVEVQSEQDPQKQRSWLLASAVLLHERRVLGDVVVITAERHVAKWAATVARLESPLGTRLALDPVVVLLSVADVEALLDPEKPALAFFAAWATHGRRGPKARAVVRRAIDLTAALPEELRSTQFRAILNVLSEPMLAWLRTTMMNPATLPENPAARALIQELEARGEVRGEARGKIEGKIEGVLAGRRTTLRHLLRLKFRAAATEAVLARLDTADAATLDGWEERLLMATTIDDALG